MLCADRAFCTEQGGSAYPVRRTRQCRAAHAPLHVRRAQSTSTYKNTCTTNRAANIQCCAYPSAFASAIDGISTSSFLEDASETVRRRVFFRAAASDAPTLARLQLENASAPTAASASLLLALALLATALLINEDHE